MLVVSCDADPITAPALNKPHAKGNSVDARSGHVYPNSSINFYSSTFSLICSFANVGLQTVINTASKTLSLNFVFILLYI